MKRRLQIVGLIGLAVLGSGLSLSLFSQEQATVSLQGTEAKGNLFFSGEAITIDFQLLETAKQKLTFEYAIRDFQGKRLDSGKRTISPRGKGKSLAQSVKAPDLKGVHVLSVSLFDGDKRLCQAEIRFGVLPRGKPGRSYSAEESDLGISIITSAKKFLAGTQNHAFVDLAGIKWNRPLIFWDLIEPKKGDYNWPLFDALINKRHEQGLALAPVIAIMNHVPRWASSQPSKSKFTDYPPKDPRDVARFVGALVKRYKGTVTHWVFDNEVNIHERTPGWNGVGTYVKCLKLSYQAAKRADPKCKIILAGVAMSDTDFVQRFYDAGGKDYYDIMAVHPYCSPVAPEDETGSLYFGQALKKKGAAFSDILAVKALMKKHGDGRKPIWITEFGWIEQHKFPKGKRPFWAGKVEVTEQQQADYYVRGYVLAKSYGVEKLFFNAMLDFPFGMGSHSLNRGMLTAELSPKLTFVAWSQMASALTGAIYEKRIDLGDEILHCHLFSQKGRGIAVIWKVKGKTSRIRLRTGDAQLTVLDMFGNQKTAKRKNGVLSLELTGSPQYLLADKDTLSSMRVVAQ